MADLEEIRALVEGTTAETERLLADVVGMSDGDVRGESALPGWSRGHVLTHLARNADAQGRVLRAALRDERVEQYVGGLEGRSREIEEGSVRPATVIVRDLEESVARLASAWGEMTEEAWDRSAAGLIAGERPAWATLWARWTEVAFHHVDLMVGFTPTEWGEDFVERFLARRLGRVADQLLEEDAVSVVATDIDLASHSQGEGAIEVMGPARSLIAWIIGREGPWLDDITTTRSGLAVGLPRMKPWG